jgi:hypothetical protein
MMFTLRFELTAVGRPRTAVSHIRPESHWRRRRSIGDRLTIPDRETHDVIGEL